MDMRRQLENIFHTDTFRTYNLNLISWKVIDLMTYSSCVIFETHKFKCLLS